MKPAIHQMETPKLNPGNSEFSHLSLNIPFPCLSPPTPPLSPPVYPPRSTFSRTRSSPIILSNGKPLKSSLKSSSAPSIPDPHRSTHLRARSAPSPPHPILKNVHFAEEKERLESVCIFSRSEEPAFLFAPHEDGQTDTENKTNIFFPNSFDFPFIPSTSHSTHTTPFHLDHTTSTIPSTVPSPYMNIHLESLALSSSSESTPVLVGFLIVRNIAYEKQVAVRFTMDNWQTTSEVLARHVVSLPSPPLAMIPSIGRAGKYQNNSWDRFAFTVRLGDFAFGLQEKVVWLVARYTTSDGEWWDNNEGCDYRIGFQAGVSAPGVAPPKGPLYPVAPTTIPTPPTPAASSPIATCVGLQRGEESPSPSPSPSSGSRPERMQGHPTLPFPVRPSSLIRAPQPRPSPPRLPPPLASVSARMPTQTRTAHGPHTHYFLAKSSPPRVSALSLNSSDPPGDNRLRLSRGRDKQAVKDPNSVYKAFVRDWCFEEGPPPTTSIGLL